MRRPIGRQRWAVTAGTEAEPAAWVLNSADEPALLVVTLFLSDQEPAGPFRVMVGARRCLHLRFGHLPDGPALAPGTAVAAVLEASVPVVVQPAPADPGRPDVLAAAALGVYAADA